MDVERSAELRSLRQSLSADAPLCLNAQCIPQSCGDPSAGPPIAPPTCAAPTSCCDGSCCAPNEICCSVMGGWRHRVGSRARLLRSVGIRGDLSNRLSGMCLRVARYGRRDPTWRKGNRDVGHRRSGVHDRSGRHRRRAYRAHAPAARAASSRRSRAVLRWIEHRDQRTAPHCRRSPFRTASGRRRARQQANLGRANRAL